VRRGGFDSLVRGAQLIGASERAIVEDTALGTRAGAAVLAELGAQLGATPDDLASWAPALERLSGHADASQRRDYARRVLTIAADGGVFVALADEPVRIAAHAELLLPGVAVQALGGSSPQFPGALWFDTSCNNKCNVGRGTNPVDTIVIHDTEGGWDASVATLQNDPGKSVHYIVDADGGRVGQFRSEDDITWHSGNSYYNGRSVGIEHVGTAADPNGFAPGLYATSAALVQNIRSRHSIPVDRTHIIGHYQVPDGNAISASSAPCGDALLTCEGSASYGGASNHRDPGPHWMWCQYMEKLGGSCACADAFSHFNCTTDKTEAVRCSGGTIEIQHCTSTCQVQATGTDDLCPVAAPSESHNPRAELPPGALHEGPVGVVPGDPPSGQAGGCAIAPRAPAGPAWLVLLALLSARAWRARRRASSRAPRSRTACR
jgi:N-acetyl-anhydromuramyl-L-alanine amidase AmpD